MSSLLAREVGSNCSDDAVFEVANGCFNGWGGFRCSPTTLLVKLWDVFSFAVAGVLRPRVFTADVLRKSFECVFQVGLWQRFLYAKLQAVPQQLVDAGGRLFDGA